MFSGLHVKYLLFLCDINETWIHSTVVQNILKYQISWKFVQWEPSCSMRTDGQTDMTKLTVAFHNVAKAPKKVFRMQWLQFTSRVTSRISSCNERVCYIWRTSAGQITFAAPSLNMVGENLLSVAIYWFKTPVPRFTADWHSGEHCTASHQAKRPERREMRVIWGGVPGFFRLQISSKPSLWSYLSALFDITKSQIRLRSSTGNDYYHI